MAVGGEEPLEHEEQEIDFCTLGMFIIDEIHYLPPTPPIHDVIGGAGTYSALGARLFSPPPASTTVGWIVDCGSDFPSPMHSQISSWNTFCLLRPTPQRLTTRGWNGYDAFQNRAFKYTTPKLRLDATSLSPTLLMSKSFHMVCSPTRCIELVTTIQSRRRKIDPDIPRPLFIWEPVPDLCTPDELLNCTNALPYVDVCSPNHAELGGFMGVSGLTDDGECDKRFVEDACEQLLGSMPLQSFALVIRCGAQGAYIAKSGGRRSSKKKKSKQRDRRRSKIHHTRGGLTQDTDMEALFAGLLSEVEEGVFEFEREEEAEEIDGGMEKWVDAYHTDGGKVVDPTGGGNAFLGGLATGLARGRGLEESVAWGAVAASFAIEQVGVPVLGTDGEGRETWNGVRVEERLEGFLNRGK